MIRAKNLTIHFHQMIIRLSTLVSIVHCLFVFMDEYAPIDERWHNNNNVNKNISLYRSVFYFYFHYSVDRRLMNFACIGPVRLSELAAMENNLPHIFMAVGLKTSLILNSCNLMQKIVCRKCGKEQLLRSLLVHIQYLLGNVHHSQAIRDAIKQK